MLVVSDANIFIDLEKIGLLIEFSKLDIAISTSDFVFNELNEQQQKLVKSLKITIYTFSSDELEVFFREYKNLGRVGISHQDYSIYYFAKQHKAYLLSNDKALRKFSNRNNINVKGIFYILDLIIEQSNLSHAKLHTSIKVLLKNTWLPKKEINQRLEVLNLSINDNMGMFT